MRKKTAYKLAFECMDKEIQRIAFNAGLFNHLNADIPSCRNASKRRKRLIEAKEIINNDLSS